MHNRPKVLFVSPILPETQGNGLAMRAASLIRALHPEFDVSLLVLSPISWEDGVLEDQLKNICSDYRRVPIPNQKTEKRPLIQRIIRRMQPRLPRTTESMSTSFKQALKSQYANQSYDYLLVFRASICSCVEPLAVYASKIVLDLDELDSNALKRISKLHLKNNQTNKSEWFAREAKANQVLEHKYLPRFSHISVSSEKERLVVSQLVKQSTLSVVPNSSVEREFLTPEKPVGTFRFLFVGAFAYYPNTEAMLYFCQTLLPAIRKRVDLEVVIDIVGNKSETLKDHFTPPEGVFIHGRVDDLMPYYQACHGVVVPIRAGGGTRIKILEALQYGRPIVSTELGAEGIEIENGSELLLADNDESFITACINLITDESLRNRLRKNGKEFVMKHHTPSVVKSRLLEMMDSV